MLRILVLLLIAIGVTADAQDPGRVTLVTSVVDSSSVPVSAADVAVVRGPSNVVAHATTNAAGRATLRIPRTIGDFQLIVRKLGFEPVYLFFGVGRGDSLVINIRVTRAVTALAPVTVTAQEDRKQKAYRLSAEDIETSTRPMIDGTDIFKLRPDMMNSRGGPSACRVFETPRDGWIESVWVNGQRVTLANVDSAVAYARKAGLGLPLAPPPRPNRTINRRPQPERLPPPIPTYSHIDTVLSILATIKAEHIQEITYHDCFDTSIEKNNGDMSMFVVLKPGVEYRKGFGSYVSDAGSADRPLVSASDLPLYRRRLLGVFDGATGDPLASVDVIDTGTGDRSRTSASGIVSLFFIPEGRNTLLVRRDGYRDTTFSVTISPTDTVPLTIILTPARPRASR